MDLHGVLEGILFVVGNEGISVEKLIEVLKIDSLQLNELIKELSSEYNDSKRGLKIEFLGNKYKLVTKVEHKSYYESLIEVEKNENLSQAALETLAVIAYNEPVTRTFVDEIRGVDSSHIIRKLVFRNLIKEIGRAELPGRPILYGVTDQFLDYLGLSSINDLPKLEDVEVDETNDKYLDLYESKYKEDSI